MAKKKKPKTGTQMHIEACIEMCKNLEEELGTVALPQPNLDAVEAVCKARRFLECVLDYLSEAETALVE